MKTVTEKNTPQNYADWLLSKFTENGVSLSVVGRDALHVKGSLTAEQRELLRIWKRQIIETLSPKCPNCNLSLELIENGNLWLCPLGCKSMEVKP